MKSNSNSPNTLNQLIKLPTPEVQPKCDDDEPINCELRHYDLINNTNLEILPEYSSLKDRNRIGVQIGLEMLDAPDLATGIDLICVLDRSFSMAGTKLLHLKQTMAQLLEVLTPQDRLCVITFNQQADRLFPLLCVNDQNKQHISKQIDQIEARGRTNFANAMELAFKCLSMRQYKNQSSSAILLTDGQDNSIHSTWVNNIPKETSIHTFGYGGDHNPYVLTRISRLGRGSYNYIHNIELLGQIFTNLIGQLQSTVAQNIKIDVTLKGCSVAELFGHQFISVADPIVKIGMPFMCFGHRRDFIIDVNVKGPITDILELVSVKLTMEQVGCQTVVEIIKTLAIPTNEDPVANSQVQLTKIEFQTADALMEAQEFCQQGMYIDAKYILKEAIERTQNYKEPGDVQHLIEELQQAQGLINDEIFQKFGKEALGQMSLQRANQVGMMTSMNSQGQQICSIDQRFLNSKQKSIHRYLFGAN